MTLSLPRDITSTLCQFIKAITNYLLCYEWCGWRPNGAGNAFGDA
jgi:hypothetical protein